MNAPILTFFNNKGGVGKTSLVYHLSWMYAQLGKRVLAVDVDPQANLTAAFLDEERIETIWEKPQAGSTIYQCVKQLTDVKDIERPRLEKINENLYLVPGDVGLSSFEDALSNEWPKSLDDSNLYRPMRILSSFWQIMQMAAEEAEADLILVDIGPNLGAINRSVLIATDYVVIPLGADLFSLQGLKNLGPALRSWRDSWNKRLESWRNNKDVKDYGDFLLPQGKMQPVGYLCGQQSVRLDRPVGVYDKWVNRMPGVYREAVLGKQLQRDVKPENDPCCLGTIKHYRSLMPMAQEARKPIFSLTSSDGAIGSHANAVQTAKKDFIELAQKIAGKIKVSL